MTRAIITILEGPDGVGKTYAADLRREKELAATGVEPLYVHNGPPARKATGKSLYREYLAQLKAAVRARAQGVSTIIDRSWPSEMVYGEVYRGRPLLSQRQVNRLERYAAKHDIVTVGLEAPDYIREFRIRHRGETWDKYQPLIGVMYHHYFQSTKGWITVSSTLAKH